MKVLKLSTNDVSGGAGRAAYRLHRGLRSSGINFRMLVQRKDSDDESVYGSTGTLGKVYSTVRSRLDQLPTKRYRNRDSEVFSPAWLPERRAKQITAHDPDIVHLHWITGGFLSVDTIKQLDAPVVWTIHDMWPFTGGCHYSKSCRKYRTECESCPHLSSQRADDLANAVWKRKKTAWFESNMIVVSPSRWLAKEAESSSLLGNKQIRVIPNGIDTNSFRPRSRTAGIQRFELDENQRYVLFGAAYETSRKGGDLLLKALEHLGGRDDITALTFGSTDVRSVDNQVPTHTLGNLSESELRLAYNTADVTVVPSREDNLPNIAVESIASGTPCVAFDVGGLSDIIDHKQTGYLAEPLEPSDLAKGIEWTIADEERRSQLSERARTVSQQRFAIESVVTRYRELYESVLED